MKKATDKQIAKFHQYLSNETRVGVLRILAKKDTCVGDLLKILNKGGNSIKKTNLSHQLSVLRDNKFVSNKREGKTLMYKTLFTQKVVNKYLSMV